MMITALIVALLGLVSTVSAISPAMADPAPGGFPGAGDTIRINNQADLAAAVALYNWNGTGTALDPYVLDGTNGDRQIDMDGAAVGLYIANITTLHFVVQNWTINNTRPARPAGYW